MSWNAVLSIVGEAMLRRFPGWIVRKLYSLDRLLREVELDVRSVRALNFSVGHSPNASATIRVTNMSPVDIEVSSVELEIWDQQPLWSHQRLTHVPQDQADLRDQGVVQRRERIGEHVPTAGQERLTWRLRLRVV